MNAPVKKTVHQLEGKFHFTHTFSRTLSASEYIDKEGIDLKVPCRHTVEHCSLQRPRGCVRRRLKSQQRGIDLNILSLYTWKGSPSCFDPKEG
jgi:hypothetical protein